MNEWDFMLRGIKLITISRTTGQFYNNANYFDAWINFNKHP